MKEKGKNIDKKAKRWHRLGLVQLIQLALSLILKERELYESKHAVVECRCLEI